MTLFKQLAMMLSLFLLIILMTVTALNFTSAIENAEQQLYSDAENTAASLSLSLAAAKGDESTMATMINANFDSGHYRRIALENMRGEVIHERLSDICKPDLPGWFTALVHIDVPAASAQVSSGWMVIGRLNVENDLSLTYQMLYSSFKSLLLSFAFFAAASISALHLLLYAILSPLRELQQQAEAIGRNEFRYQDTLPFTKEFREIVVTMNAMVKKIENSFKMGSRAMQRNRRLLYTEKLPRLYNEHYLMLKCQEEFMGSSEYDGGAVLVAELSDLDIAVEKLGEATTEELLTELAAFLIERASGAAKSVAARLSKTRFALLMPGSNEAEALGIAAAVRETFRERIAFYGIDTCHCEVLAGVYAFGPNEECRSFIEKAIAGVQGAQTAAPGSLQNQQELTQERWEELIAAALKEERFGYHVRNVIETRHNAIYDRSITIVMKSEEGGEYPYGRFIAPAVKAHKVFEIYLQVIRALVKNFTERDKKGRYTFSFAKTLLLEERTFSSLEEEFRNFDNTHDLDFCIELPESFIVENPGMAGRYVDLIKAHGYRFGIGEFSAQSDDLDYLQRFRPEFIKVSKLYLLDMVTRSSPLLNSLLMAAGSLGIRVIATGVSTPEELETIREAHIDIVQGFITEIL
jgi:EAL domain-containing protein (putative c-di-GMP-specific phosphodiesterase class I)